MLIYYTVKPINFLSLATVNGHINLIPLRYLQFNRALYIITLWFLTTIIT